MKHKIPIAMIIAALLIAIPGVARLVTSEATAAPLLTPGTADVGQRDAAERVAFWRDRIAGKSDHINRVHAGVALLELARQTAQPDSYAAALTMADDALRANPSSVDARVLRAAALSSDHRFDEALADAALALDADPDNFQAHAVAGDALLELGRYPESALHLDTLAADQPQAPAVLARQAEFAWDTGDSLSALSYGKQALARANEAALSPGELSFYAIRLARFHLDTGDVEAASALAHAALDIAPDIPAVHSTLGFVYQTEGDTLEAIEAFERSVAIVPLREALTALVELHSSQGNTRAAGAAATRLEELGPDPTA